MGFGPSLAILTKGIIEMPYLLSGGATYDMARIAHEAFKLFVKIGPHCPSVDAADVKLAEEMLKTEFTGWGLEEEDNDESRP